MPLTDNGLEILSPEQCHDLLRRSTVGRVAVTIAALPAIFPVNYAILDGQIVFRTGEGTKLRAAADRAVVAFQIDHFDEATGDGWSVMAIGLAEEITDPDEKAKAERLGLRPFAGGDRSHFVKIHPEFVSGRRIV
jgi:nitroimidazol reductase NimA-like FMN-containing flavoprotein (pyridoxamine 5'-phosphate oxidase superfamily)